MTRHSETSKHIERVAKDPVLPGVGQLTIQEALSGKVVSDQKEQDDHDKTQEFEIHITRALSNHKISNYFLNCLQDILKKHCSDSIVVQRMKLGRTKGNYYAAHGIGKMYQDETVRLLKECDAFSTGFDESEVNETSEHEILVKLSHPVSGIELRHYRTIEMYSGTTETIVDTILSSFDEDGINYRMKLVAPMTDGCATMQGKRSGVKKRSAEKVPQMKDLGSCGGHHISNAMMHATEAFDKDAKEALVNIFFDIGGAKGKGLKKKKEFE